MDLSFLLLSFFRNTSMLTLKFACFRELKHQFQQFADSWNAIREKVKGYECKQLTIPIMNEDARLATCLVEPRDHGLYIVALFHYLLTLQNVFLRDAADAVDANSRESTPRQVRVQACKVWDSYTIIYVYVLSCSIFTQTHNNSVFFVTPPTVESRRCSNFHINQKRECILFQLGLMYLNLV